MNSDLPTFADFLFGDSNDPVLPPREFIAARREHAWAREICEPVLRGGPRPRSTLVTRDGGDPVINLASYDYLGLGQHPAVIEAAREALASRGTGACGSPFLSGLSDLHQQLERELNAFLGREATMLFNSGFAGAFGTVAGLLRRGDVAALDARSHFSLQDGAAFARAKIEAFAHNDPAALNAALARHRGQRRLVVLEGIYSMDGDLANLPPLLDVAESHGVHVLLDEAHSVLACGENGRGVAEQLGVEPRVALYFGTFSKAFAGLGGFLSGPADTIEYLRFFARNYTFSCALPPATVGGLLGALAVAQRDGSKLRCRLRENAEYFRAQLHSLGFDTGASASHVVPIFWRGDRRRFYETAGELRRHGVFLAPIDFPAVPLDALRFRASITAAHTRADLDEALGIIAATFR